MSHLYLAFVSLLIGLGASGFLIPGHVSGSHNIIPVTPLLVFLPLAVFFFIRAIQELSK